MFRNIAVIEQAKYQDRFKSDVKLTTILVDHNILNKL